MSQISLKSTACGLVIGTLVLCSNFQFGLQTGWVSMMSMPAALLGFAWFKLIRSGLTAQDNVYVQSVAVAVGTGPLSFGLVGAIPAIELLLTNEEGKTLFMVFQLTFWSLGIAFMGIFTAILFKELIIGDPHLKFPSGSAAAALIGVLHKKSLKNETVDSENINRGEVHGPPDISTNQNGSSERGPSISENQSESSITDTSSNNEAMSAEAVTDFTMHNGQYSNASQLRDDNNQHENENENGIEKKSYKKNIITLVTMFSISSICTLLTKSFDFLRGIPIFGPSAAAYMWQFDLSPAYIGQGIIMGLETTTAMMLGAILGWAILAPLSKTKGWALGPIDDWSSGAQGWIMWVSLAIMIGDTGVSFILLTYKTIVDLRRRSTGSGFLAVEEQQPYLDDQIGSENIDMDLLPSANIESAKNQRKLAYWGICGSVLLCIFCIKILFRGTPILATTIAILISPFLSLLGVRALGETDLNPVSSIAKLTQFIFGILMQSKPNSVLLNIVAGAITEAGAQQAGDLMQDFKTGSLLGASMTNQTIGMLIGTVWSAIASGCIYRLYMSHYTIPGPEFRIPTAYIWADCARLMTGQGLPPKSDIFALMFGILFGALAVFKHIYKEANWSKWIPSGVAVGIGMYNVPSFTLARLIGGVIAYMLQRYHLKSSEKAFMVILSSGLILGEGIMSVIWLLITI